MSLQSKVFPEIDKVESSVAEFSVSICSTPKFVCSSGDDVLRLLITENDTSYKSSIHKDKVI